MVFLLGVINVPFTFILSPYDRLLNSLSWYLYVINSFSLAFISIVILFLGFSIIYNTINRQTVIPKVWVLIVSFITIIFKYFLFLNSMFFKI